MTRFKTFVLLYFWFKFNVTRQEHINTIKFYKHWYIYHDAVFPTTKDKRLCIVFPGCNFYCFFFSWEIIVYIHIYPAISMS